MDEIKISIPHFYCLEYKKNDKRMSIDIDFREPKILFGRRLIQNWEIPYSNEKLFEEEKEEIYTNVMHFY